VAWLLVILVKRLCWIRAFKASTQSIKYFCTNDAGSIVAVWSVLSSEFAKNLVIVPPGQNVNHGRVEQ